MRGTLWRAQILFINKNGKLFSLLRHNYPNTRFTLLTAVCGCTFTQQNVAAISTICWSEGTPVASYYVSCASRSQMSRQQLDSSIDIELQSTVTTVTGYWFIYYAPCELAFLKWSCSVRSEIARLSLSLRSERRNLVREWLGWPNPKECIKVKCEHWIRITF